MGTEFVPQGKCTIFWLNRGLRVYLDLYVSDFPKSISKYFLYPSTFYILVLFFIPKHPIVEAFLVEQPPKSFKIYFSHAKQMENLGKIHLKCEFEKV